MPFSKKACSLNAGLEHSESHFVLFKGLAQVNAFESISTVYFPDISSAAPAVVKRSKAGIKLRLNDSFGACLTSHEQKLQLSEVTFTKLSTAIAKISQGDEVGGSPRFSHCVLMVKLWFLSPTDFPSYRPQSPLLKLEGGGAVAGKD